VRAQRPFGSWRFWGTATSNQHRGSSGRAPKNPAKNRTKSAGTTVLGSCVGLRGRDNGCMILLRHGQSEFNLVFTATRRDPGIRDPELTAGGREQADALARCLVTERVCRIIVSPYTRALQTAAPIGRLLRLPLVINPIVRERYAFMCDIGTPCSALARAWPEHDFSHLEEIWWPPIEESADSVTDRATLFCAEMAALPDWSDTLVVSHWGFILALTGISLGNGDWLRWDPTGPRPTEIRWRP
jgi:broad specificity phosphatase PhoE